MFEDRTTVSLDAESLDVARRGVIEAAERDAQSLADELEALRKAAPGKADPRHVRGAYALLQKSMKALKKLGWPE